MGEKRMWNERVSTYNLSGEGETSHQSEAAGEKGVGISTDAEKGPLPPPSRPVLRILADAIRRLPPSPPFRSRWVALMERERETDRIVGLFWSLTQRARCFTACTFPSLTSIWAHKKAPFLILEPAITQKSGRESEIHRGRHNDPVIAH